MKKVGNLFHTWLVYPFDITELLRLTLGDYQIQTSSHRRGFFVLDRLS